MVVLAIHPSLARNGRRGQQAREHFRRRRRLAERGEGQLLCLFDVRRLRHWTPIHRRIVGERAIRDLGDDIAVIAHAKLAVGRDLAHPHGMQIPFLEDALDFRLASALDHHQHALLRFGEHDFVRRHTGLALRNERDVDVHAGAAA